MSIGKGLHAEIIHKRNYLTVTLHLNFYAAAVGWSDCLFIIIYAASTFPTFMEMFLDIFNYDNGITKLVRTVSHTNNYISKVKFT